MAPPRPVSSVSQDYEVWKDHEEDEVNSTAGGSPRSSPLNGVAIALNSAKSALQAAELIKAIMRIRCYDILYHASVVADKCRRVLRRRGKQQLRDHILPAADLSMVTDTVQVWQASLAYEHGKEPTEEGVQAAEFLVRACYSDAHIAVEHSALDVLHQGALNRARFLHWAVITLLRRILAPGHTLYILMLADTLGWTALRDAAMLQALAQWEPVAEAEHADLLELGTRLLVQLLNNPHLQVTGELQAWDALFAWTKHDQQTRGPLLSKLLPFCVGLEGLSQQELQEHILSHPLLARRQEDQRVQAHRDSDPWVRGAFMAPWVQDDLVANAAHASAEGHAKGMHLDTSAQQARDMHDSDIAMEDAGSLQHQESVEGGEARLAASTEAEEARDISRRCFGADRNDMHEEGPASPAGREYSSKDMQPSPSAEGSSKVTVQHTGQGSIGRVPALAVAADASGFPPALPPPAHGGIEQPEQGSASQDEIRGAAEALQHEIKSGVANPWVILQRVMALKTLLVAEEARTGTSSPVLAGLQGFLSKTATRQAALMKTTTGQAKLLTVRQEVPSSGKDAPQQDKGPELQQLDKHGAADRKTEAEESQPGMGFVQDGWERAASRQAEGAARASSPSSLAMSIGAADPRQKPAQHTEATAPAAAPVTVSACAAHSPEIIGALEGGIVASPGADPQSDVREEGAAGGQAAEGSGRGESTHADAASEDKAQTAAADADAPADSGGGNGDGGGAPTQAAGNGGRAHQEHDQEHDSSMSVVLSSVKGSMQHFTHKHGRNSGEQASIPASPTAAAQEVLQESAEKGRRVVGSRSPAVRAMNANDERMPKVPRRRK